MTALLLTHQAESPESHRDHVTGSDSARRQSYDRRPSTTLETSFYDAGDSKPTSPLIQHLCEVFFSHVGCIYPFLQRESFLKDLSEKKVDTILVDAVCAISARFSTHPILTNAGKGTNSPKKGGLHKSKHGRVFAKRAMSRVTESFACPTIAAVQACLLLAYEQFGSDHDSGLWMWLGISIRLAQDLGLQKYDGLSHDVHMGANPNFLAIGSNDHIPVGQHPISNRQSLCARTDSDPMRMRCDREILDKKRNDTFWAVFFLDRAISSGTGRPATLRDTDIEISFPSSDETDPETGWPTPFPFLVRIIHLYGRVTDLLNSIQEIDHVTPDMLQRLAAFESDLTGKVFCFLPSSIIGLLQLQVYTRDYPPSFTSTPAISNTMQRIHKGRISFFCIYGFIPSSCCCINPRSCILSRAGSSSCFQIHGSWLYRALRL